MVPDMRVQVQKEKGVYILPWQPYLTRNSDEEVDHCVCMLFLHRLGEHGLCPWYGLATAKHLKTNTNKWYFKLLLFHCHRN